MNIIDGRAYVDCDIDEMREDTILASPSCFCVHGDDVWLVLWKICVLVRYAIVA